MVAGLESKAADVTEVNAGKPSRLRFTDARGPYGLSAWWWLFAIVILLMILAWIAAATN